MANRRGLIAAAGILLLTCGGLTPAVHAEDACPDGQVQASPIKVIDYLWASMAPQIEEAQETAQVEAMESARKREDRKGPEAKKVGAPSTSPGSTSLVDSPAFTDAVQLAWESGLISNSDGVLTVDLNLFAFKAAKDKLVRIDQAVYDAPINRKLRRFGGAVSFGGQGEKFDRDGDGTADEALQAKQLGDIVTYELRYRIFGSRDRREDSNAHKYFNSKAAQEFRRAAQGSPGEQGPVADAAQRILSDLENASLVVNRCVPAAEIDQRFQPYRDQIIENFQKPRYDVDRLLETIDNAPILTLAVGGVSRQDDFGTDERYAALRYAWGSLESELMYKEKDAFIAADPDPTTLTLGTKYSFYVLEGVLGDAKTLVSLEGSYEHFRDVPDAEHSTVATLGLKTEFKLTDTVTVPLSITWANHQDLLSDDDEVRGHIGLSFDVGSLLGEPAKK